MLPVKAIQRVSCTAETISAAGHSCGSAGGKGPLAQQHLFSVYVHVGTNEDFIGENKASCQIVGLQPSVLSHHSEVRGVSCPFSPKRCQERIVLQDMRHTAAYIVQKKLWLW